MPSIVLPQALCSQIIHHFSELISLLFSVSMMSLIDSSCPHLRSCWSRVMQSESASLDGLVSMGLFMALHAMPNFSVWMSCPVLSWPKNSKIGPESVLLFPESQKDRTRTTRTDLTSLGLVWETVLKLFSMQKYILTLEFVDEQAIRIFLYSWALEMAHKGSGIVPPI